MLQAAILTCNPIASLEEFLQLPKSGLILGCALGSFPTSHSTLEALSRYLLGRNFVELLAAASKNEKKSTRHR